MPGRHQEIEREIRHDHVQSCAIPTAETSPTRRARLAPPSSLDGKTVALMDIGKSRGKEFIDRLEGHFKTAGIATNATPSRPTPRSRRSR